MIYIKFLTCISVFIVTSMAHIELAAAARIAIIVSNFSYVGRPTLITSEYDSSSLVNTLKKIGFRIETIHNTTTGDLTTKLESIKASLKKDDTIVFYYTGYSLNFQKHNFLLNVNATLSHESDIERQAVSIEFIMRHFANAVKTSVIIWDACRKNPISAVFRRNIENDDPRRAPSVGIGAADIEHSITDTSLLTSDIFILFSAKPGTIALDDESSRNSPFVSAVLAHIEKPGVELLSMLRMVKDDIHKFTNGQQQLQDKHPLKLKSDFFFTGTTEKLGSFFEVPDSIKNITKNSVVIAQDQPLAQAHELAKTPTPLSLGNIHDNLPPLTEDGSAQYTRKLLSSRVFVPLSTADTLRIVKYSFDHTRLIFAGDGGTIYIFDAETLMLIKALRGHDRRVRSIDLSPDGKRMVSSGWDGKVKLWNIETGEVIKELETEGEPIYSVAINPGWPDRYIIAGDKKGRLLVWDLKRNKRVGNRLFHHGPVHSLAYHPNKSGTYISAGGDGMIRTVRWPSGRAQSVNAHGGPVSYVGYSADGNSLMTAGYDKVIKIWRSSDLFLLKTFPGHLKYVLAASFIQNGSKIASSGGDKTIILRDAQNGEILHRFVGHFGDVESLAISKDGKRIISVSEDNTIRIWNTYTRTEILSGAIFPDEPSPSYIFYNNFGKYSGPSNARTHIRLIENGHEYQLTDNYDKSFYVGSSAAPLF